MSLFQIESDHRNTLLLLRWFITRSDLWEKWLKLWFCDVSMELSVSCLCLSHIGQQTCRLLSNIINQRPIWQKAADQSIDSTETSAGSNCVSVLQTTSGTSILINPSLHPITGNVSTGQEEGGGGGESNKLVFEIREEWRVKERHEERELGEDTCQVMGHQSLSAGTWTFMLTLRWLRGRCL